MKKKKVAKRKPQHAEYRIEDGITQSILSDWVSCRQRSRYRLDGWRSLGTSKSLRFGSLFHSLLQDLYQTVRDDHRFSKGAFLGKGKPNKKVLESFFAGFSDKHMKSVLQTISDPEEIQAHEDDLLIAGVIFPEYCKAYQEDFTPSRWTEVEGTFSVGWKSWRLRGRIDGVMRIKKGLWLLETKTKSRIDENLLSTALTFDFQNLFYLLCAEECFESNEKIKGVLYNIVRVPSLRQGKKETFAGLVDRIRADIKERPEHYFKRFEINYDQSDRERFAKDLEFKLIEFERWHRGMMPTYRNENACTGKWNCTYLDACASGEMAGYLKNGRPFAELEV